MKKRIALTIAGSDPSGGAGVQADIKSFNAVGVHGLSVITCLTVQNTKRVVKIISISPKEISQQIDVLLEDVKPDIVKTGMLYEKNIVSIVSDRISQNDLRVVVDPVMVATSGDSLSKSDFVDAIKNKLIPITFILTPNIMEAEVLTDLKLSTLESIKKSCKDLYDLGAKNVLIKGGHLKGPMVKDVFFDGSKFNVLSLPRIDEKKAHGSGCTLSAVIAGLIAKGITPLDAVNNAKYIIWNMINQGYIIGKGSDVLDHSVINVCDVPLSFPSNTRFSIWRELKDAIDELLNFLPLNLIPEVGINFGYALKDAKSTRDVCAINGRIVKTLYHPARIGEIDFGASKHIASIILAAMKYYPNTRCAMNIKFSKETIENFKKINLSIGNFDRTDEPKDVKSTMEWGTGKAISKLNYVPDIIYDEGGLGKEPMIRILGKDPNDVIGKAHSLLKSRI
ncbi:MAG: bifunctional hydroxymethylpyrimidine kinase/phosphomethylpyrimidine kinase [Candidatus Thermoplasmatota archaeon]|nr:bifunctional hydroxymethylpyrimidine kinase/phosphomethylpyrimidine kinase [Candidatus Thermoplasmatota archaeon]